MILEAILEAIIDHGLPANTETMMLNGYGTNRKMLFIVSSLYRCCEIIIEPDIDNTDSIEINALEPAYKNRCVYWEAAIEYSNKLSKCSFTSTIDDNLINNIINTVDIYFDIVHTEYKKGNI